MTQSGNKHERYALVRLRLLDLGFALLLSSSRCSTGTLSRWPFGVSRHSRRPLFEQALDNSQQLCLGWSFTLGASLSLNTLGQLGGPTPTILGSSRSPVTMDVMFELFDNELLITNDAVHHIANRNYAN